MLTIKSLIIVLVLTTLAGAASVWQQVSTPAGATHIRGFGINNANNHWFLADRQSGFWKSTDQGNTWSQINNSGIPNCGWTIDYDTVHNQLLAGVFVGDVTSCPVSFWKSGDEGNTWTQITPPSGFSYSLNPSKTGPAVAPSGIINWGGRDAGGGVGNSCGGWYSTDNGVTTNPINAINGASLNCLGTWSWLYNPVTNDEWFNMERIGTYRSSDSRNFTLVLSRPNWGDPYGLTYDPTNGNVFVGGHDSGANAAVFKSSRSNGNYTFSVVATPIGSVRAIGNDPAGNLYFGQQDTNGQVTPCDTTAVYRSTDHGATWSAWTSGIRLSSVNCNLEAMHFVYNSTDTKLYLNVQDGATNNGYVYVTVQPITGGTAGLQPPMNLQLNIR